MTASARAQALAPTRRSHLNIVGALVIIGSIAGLAGLAGCSSTGANDLPPGVQDPAIIKTPDGALAFYRGVLRSVPGMFNQLTANVGVMTDELAGLAAPVGVSNEYTDLDSRNVSSQNPGPAGKTYTDLHKIRAQAREARGFLTTYASDSSALIGHLYAVEGYAIVFLADLYCSGVPLSTVDFGGDYTMAAGSTTEELYQQAQALFDTAVTLSDANHPQLQQLAAVGRGRALLALGRYDSAAAAVATVPTEFRYELLFNGFNTLVAGFATWAVSGGPVSVGSPVIGDGEGVNGLNYRSSGDPRTPVVVLGTDVYGNRSYFLANWPTEGPTTFLLANSIEARLIEAEAALNDSSPNWLTTLNALRTDGTFDTQPNADDPSKMDTLWRAGTGGVAGLDTLSDPGNADARVSLLFRERAFWLYLTAHRQGDLRRLVRQYHRAVTAAYPTNFFVGGGNGQYGSDVTLPVPAEEQQFNPNYAGCLNRSA